MRYSTPEIAWHNKDPVLSVDIQADATEEFYRLASGGSDTHVVIWHVKLDKEKGAYNIRALAELTKHQRAVNVVRWSPCSEYLASADDDGNIILWHRKADELAVTLNEDTNEEKWSIYKILRGHTEDVYDICWSNDSKKLLSGSVDNTAIIWNVDKGGIENILKEHKGFVQGVSWDPLGQYIVTFSGDRCCRIFNENGKQVKYRISKGMLPVPETHPLHAQAIRYFHDDTLKSFFRRLTFSPDGTLLITPSGCIENEDGSKLYATYIFTTTDFSKPAIVIPSPKICTVVVRCSPLLYELREDGPKAFIDLPYRIIIAIATCSTVVLYDTQQNAPFAMVSDMHYTRLTDLAWSPDGRLLMVSSSDGFCSFISFKEQELGVVYQGSTDLPESVDEEQEQSETSSTKSVEQEQNINTEKNKKPKFIKQWAIKNRKLKKPTEIKCSSDEVVEIDDSEDDVNDSKTEENDAQQSTEVDKQKTSNNEGRMEISKHIKKRLEKAIKSKDNDELVTYDHELKTKTNMDIDSEGTDPEPSTSAIKIKKENIKKETISSEINTVEEKIRKLRVVKKFFYKCPKGKKSFKFVSKDKMDIDDDDDDCVIVEPETETKDDTNEKDAQTSITNPTTEVNKENIKQQTTGPVINILKPKRVPSSTVDDDDDCKIIEPQTKIMKDTKEDESQSSVNKPTTEENKDVKKQAKLVNVLIARRVPSSKEEPPSKLIPRKTRRKVYSKFVVSPKKPKLEKTKEKSEDNTVTSSSTAVLDTNLLEEENARDKWNDETSSNSVKDEKVLKPIILPDIVMIEDSQDMKLVLEDTISEENKQGDISNSNLDRGAQNKNNFDTELCEKESVTPSVHSCRRKENKKIVASSSEIPEVSDSTAKKPKLFDVSSEQSKLGNLDSSSEQPKVSGSSSEQPKVLDSSEQPKVSGSSEQPKVSGSSEQPKVLDSSSEPPKVSSSSEKPKVLDSSSGESKVSGSLEQPNILGSSSEQPEVLCSSEQPTDLNTSSKQSKFLTISSEESEGLDTFSEQPKVLDTCSETPKILDSTSRTSKILDSTTETPKVLESTSENPRVLECTSDTSITLISSSENSEDLSNFSENPKVLSSSPENPEDMSSSPENREDLSSSLENPEDLSSSGKNLEVVSSSSENPQILDTCSTKVADNSKVSNLSSNSEVLHCSKDTETSNSSTVPGTSGVPQNVSNVDVPKDPVIVKKKVPFFTLSSPKIKKKPL